MQNSALLLNECDSIFKLQSMKSPNAQGFLKYCSCLTIYLRNMIKILTNESAACVAIKNALHISKVKRFKDVPIGLLPIIADCYATHNFSNIIFTIEILD